MSEQNGRNGSTGEVIEVDRAEILRMIEEGSFKRRGLHAGDFLSQFRAGELDDPGEVLDLLVLADLLPEDDPLFVARP